MQNLHLTFDWHYIQQNFVAFSEYMNFKNNDSQKNNDLELQNQNNSTLELSLFELQMDSTLKTNGLKPT